jgi:hypothetical protein
MGGPLLPRCDLQRLVFEAHRKIIRGSLCKNASKGARPGPTRQAGGGDR